MFKIDFDARPLIRHLDNVGKRQLPFATMQALNQTMFEVHAGWGDEIEKVFDRPTSFTRRSVLYKKATKQRLEAQVFVRDEAAKGNPPARYLQPEAIGGPRRPKPYENDLRAAGVLGQGEYTVPARGMRLDGSGNIPLGVITAILSDLQASKDERQRSTRESRGRRARRRSLKRSVYFYWPGDTGQGRTRHRLPRGIYERIATGFGSGIRMVLAIVSDTPTYSVRFDAYGLARKIFHARFPINFNEHLARALKSAK